MSFLTQSLHTLAKGDIAEWARYNVSYLKRHVGTPLTPEAADAAVTDIEGFKHTVQAAAEAILIAKLGPFGGPLAAQVADHAISAVATAVESAARALESQTPAP